MGILYIICTILDDSYVFWGLMQNSFNRVVLSARAAGTVELNSCLAPLAISVLHHANGPISVFHHANGPIYVLHHTNGLISLLRHPNGPVPELHHETGPISVLHHENGQKFVSPNSHYPISP